MVRVRNGILLGVLVAFLGFAFTSTTAVAGGGNSDAAKLCQREWQTLRTSDGESFKNQGKCVSYAAKGGEFAPADPAAARLAFCNSLGGTLGSEQRGGVTVWICDGLPTTPPPTTNYGPFCTGTVTTEARNGLVALICTPS